MAKRLILLSNDDGYDSPGIRILKDGLKDLGRVVISAPLREMSASSHSITLRREIKVEEVEPDVFAVSGTPADSVLIAIYGILERMPDIIISGINDGHNLGEDVFYSGTVAAAREGAMYGVPSLAASLVLNQDPHRHYESAVYFVRKIALVMMEEKMQGELMNLNVPNSPLDEIKGLKITRLSTRRYKDPVMKLRENLYVIGGEPLWNREKGTDLEAVLEGYASLTPLLKDITDYEKIGFLERIKERIS
ncbi:MAG: 5'/3'-nucleotidase SurE [Candidatus Hydrothermota bacterium]|nr:MAG: 5'/3'-nucleotidase SurE [Candidatus Hydrothermae bacterium]